MCWGVADAFYSLRSFIMLRLWLRCRWRYDEYPICPKMSKIDWDKNLKCYYKINMADDSSDNSVEIRTHFTMDRDTPIIEFMDCLNQVTSFIINDGDDYSHFNIFFEGVFENDMEIAWLLVWKVKDVLDNDDEFKYRSFNVYKGNKKMKNRNEYCPPGNDLIRAVLMP